MCPLAIPIVLPGEVITEKTVGAMKYYGYKNCRITKEAEI